jgi:hypothetical protein
MTTDPLRGAVVDIAVRNAVFSLIDGAALNLAQPNWHCLIFVRKGLAETENKALSTNVLVYYVWNNRVEWNSILLEDYRR